MEGDILKEYAEPYAWLQQAFWEKDARRKFSLIYKLVPHFEEEIVTGIHFNTLKLDENKAEPEESVPEAFCAETDSADREKKRQLKTQQKFWKNRRSVRKHGKIF